MRDEALKNKLLGQLDKVKKESAELYRGKIMVALSNGEEIIGVSNQTHTDHLIVESYKKQGYRVVQSILNGRVVDV